VDQESYDVAQQGLLVCLLGEDHEQRLNAFLDGLRRDSRWAARIGEVEAKIRELLGGSDHADETEISVDSGQPLSRREEEVLRLMARGYTAKEIASKHNLSAKTVETYKLRSFTKLGLTGRPDIIRYALEHGWFDDPAEETPA
jgi:DNA-binding NarL/FixJ family response regulator